MRPCPDDPAVSADEIADWLYEFQRFQAQKRMSLATKRCTDCQGKGGSNIRIPFMPAPGNKQWENCDECAGTGEQPKTPLEWEEAVRELASRELTDFTELAELAGSVRGLLTLVDELRSQPRAQQWVPLAEWEKKHHVEVNVLWVLYKGWNISSVYWDEIGQFWRRQSSGGRFPHEVHFVTHVPTVPAPPSRKPIDLYDREKDYYDDEPDGLE